MTSRGAAWTIHACELPADLDDPRAWPLHGAAAVSHAVELDSWGHADLAAGPRELLARLRNRRYVRRVRLVVVPAGSGDTPGADDVVGTADVVLPQQSNQHVVFLTLLVHPAHRGRGAGATLLAQAERIGVAEGRTTVIAETDHPGQADRDDPTAIEPPTGSGWIAGTDPGARFALHRGYALEQAERYSVLDLPLADGVLGPLRADAAERAGSEYRLISWADRTPDEWLDQYADLYTRMSTDVPVGDLDIEEDSWDAERVRTAERSKADGGHGYFTVVAEHVPTARLAAFTMVEYPLDQPGVVFQEDTLVVPEHRGRRLGMLVKTELMERLREVRPQAARVHTWNAEENEHMLAINVALGFRPLGVAGEWQKRLS